MSRELHDRARELEEASATIHAELDSLYAALTEANLREVKAVVGAILRHPTSSRQQVQSSLPILNDKL